MSRSVPPTVGFDGNAQPNFAGLGALAAVGDHWMAGCGTLVEPNFGGLAASSDDWMSNCPALIAIHSDPARQAERRAAALQP
jgi:hypothetical protein